MATYSLWEKLRYQFDNFMSRGGSSIFIALVVVFLSALIVIGGLRVTVFALYPDDVERPERGGWNQVYQVFNHLSDPGTMAYDINSGLPFKATAILAGMVGVVLFSALIAFITTALDQKLNELKKGHSKVIEGGHTLILGWNERVVEILRELILANESETNPCVVILSKTDKEEMDDYLKLHLPMSARQNTRIVTRSGLESSLINLEIASVTTSKSVIVLANCNVSASHAEKASSDTMIIKTVLALVAARPETVELNVVAEIFFPRNRRIVGDISPREVRTIDTNEILAKVLVQTSRSVGLSVVYSEILSFEGCEMYFHEAAWGDMAWENLAFHFPDGVPLGVRRADQTLLLNPSADTVVQQDDAVLILAQDDSTIDFRPEPVATAREFALSGGRRQLARENNLIIGWTPKVETIIREYADYVLAGSRIRIMLRAQDDTVVGQIARLNDELPDVTIDLIDANPLETEGLLTAKPFDFDNIIILSQSGAIEDDERTDSETIVILLLLRQIFREHPKDVGNIKLITEILDSENQALVARTGVHDFIISNQFVSMVLAQISEDGDMQRVYDDLFSEDGSEIYLKPASLYFEALPVEVTYADLIRIAQQRHEVCLGVKIKALEREIDHNFGVTLIPEKNTQYTLTDADTLVVLSEDET